MRRLPLLLLLLACAPLRPATRAELLSRDLTVRGGDDVARALREAGFRVVAHAPYRGELELTVEGTRGTLRSDGLWVADVEGESPQALAAALARAPEVASFIRNNGLPQQQPFTQ